MRRYYSVLTVAIKNQSLFYPRETNKTLWSVTHVAGTGRKALVDKQGGLPWKPLAPALSESELGLTLLQVSAVFWECSRALPLSAGITCSSGRRQAAPGDTSWKWSPTSGSDKLALTCLESCNKGKRRSKGKMDTWWPSAASERARGLPLVPCPPPPVG